MNFKKFPDWILSGIIIFPVLIVLGIILFVLTLGKINILFWLVIPSVAFEQIFETFCYKSSNRTLANLLFAFFFWFIIGATEGWISGKLKK